MNQSVLQGDKPLPPAGRSCCLLADSKENKNKASSLIPSPGHPMAHPASPLASPPLSRTAGLLFSKGGVLQGRRRETVGIQGPPFPKRLHIFHGRICRSSLHGSMACSWIRRGSRVMNGEIGAEWLSWEDWYLSTGSELRETINASDGLRMLIGSWEEVCRFCGSGAGGDAICAHSILSDFCSQLVSRAVKP